MNSDLFYQGVKHHYCLYQLTQVYIVFFLSVAAGETHEVHPPSVSAPSIVVHLCDEESEFQGVKPKIMQTKRPDVV